MLFDRSAHRPLMLLVAAAAGAWMQVASAQTTYYVDGSCGNDAWTGQSPVCEAPNGPKATLQAGLDVAFFGDTVLVADGVYAGPGNKNLTLPNGVVLRSENGPAACIVDCEDAGRGFGFFSGEGPETVVDGFTVTNGMAPSGGGFLCYYNSAPTIANCVITGNADTGGGGGGVYGTVASPTIVNCVIANNTAVSPGGGGIYTLFGNPTIVNCTIVGNSTPGAGGAIHLTSTSHGTIRNSILWGNGPDEIFVDDGSTISVGYTAVQGGWAGTGNQSSNPFFADLPGGDFRLAPSSPCIDAGDNVAVPVEFAADLDGEPRFVDDPTAADSGAGRAPIVDLGAFERQAAPGVKAPTTFGGTVRRH